MGEWGTAIRISKRLLSLLFVIWLTATVVFLLFRVFPDHNVLVPRTNNQQLIHLIYSEYRLEYSLTDQYLWHLLNTFELDFGISAMWARGVDINDIVGPFLVRSLWMFAVVCSLSLLIGVAYEAIASITKRRIPRMTLRLAALLPMSAPVLGFTMLCWELNLRLGAPLPVHSFPYSGSLFGEADDLDRLYYNISHGVLPVAIGILLTFGFITLFYRGQAAAGLNLGNFRREVGRVFGSIRANPWPTKFLFAWIFSCVLAIDLFFNYHGLGTLLFDSISYRDFPLIMALFFILAMILAVSNTVFDIACMIMPRKEAVPADTLSPVHEHLPPHDAEREAPSFLELLKSVCVSYRGSKAGVAALVVFLALSFIALTAPYLSTVRDPANPDNFEPSIFPGDWRNPLSPSLDPSPYTGIRHILGTDQVGMDMYSALLYGSREPVMACFIIGTISLVLGVLAGVVGSMLPPTKGLGTKAMSWLAGATADTFVAIPLFMIIFALFFDQRWGFWVAAFLVAPIVFLWAAMSIAQQARHSPSVNGSKSVHRTIVMKRSMPTILARALYVTKIAIVIGLLTLIIFDPYWGTIGQDRTNWGSIIGGAYERDAVVEGAWWWYIPPIIGICVLLASSFVILDTLEAIVRRSEGTAGALAPPSPEVTAT